MKRKPKPIPKMKIAPYKYIAIYDTDDREVDEENDDYLVDARILAHGKKDYVMGEITSFILKNKLNEVDIAQGLKVFKVGEPQVLTCKIVREPVVSLDF